MTSKQGKLNIYNYIYNLLKYSELFKGRKKIIGSFQ